MTTSRDSKETTRRGRGRPPVEAKRVPFQVMLDPRYLAHLRKVAKQKKVNVQDLARWALTALVPDPYNPITGPEALLASEKPRK
jgi:hypothetical protein